MSLGTILLIVVVLMLFGAYPGFGFHHYGYAPFGGFGLVFIILLVLVLTGRI
jgi:hypothetical protein